MNFHQLQPLLINDETGEPYLRLPHPHSHIIITPFRLEDAPDIVPILNDERIYKWLSATPYPYLLEHAESWIEGRREKSYTLLDTLRKDGSTELKLVNGCPVNVLREVKENGRQVFLGDISFVRCGWEDEVDAEKRRLVDRNESRPLGDPELLWAVGDYIVASHHGQGIMTAALGTLLREWGIPRMGIKHMRVNTLMGNKGSVRVFEKNGFVLVGSVERCLDVRGEMIGLNILERPSEFQS